MKKVAIVGVGMSEIGMHTEKNSLILAVPVIKSALADAGLSLKDLDGIFMVPEGFGVRCTKMRPQRLAEYFDVPLKATATIECGGVSSMLAVKYAMNEIMLGNCEMCLVFASEVERYKRKEPQDQLQALVDVNTLYIPYDSPYGILSAIGYYAMMTQRYMFEYGITPEQIATLPVILRENASKNPKAQFREPITIEDVLSSKIISPPIHLLESSPMSDGAAAIILASEERAKKLDKKPIFITGVGEWHDSSHFIVGRKTNTFFSAVKKSAEIAFKKSGKGIEDIDVAEIYGAFAGVELMTYEDVGFFEKGKAPEAVVKGETKIGGRIPINTSGGRLSLGHPPFATPLMELMEVTLQLRGEAGGRQVNGAKTGLAQAEHGAVNGSIIMILEAG